VRRHNGEPVIVRFEEERSRYSRYARASRSQSKRLVIYAVLLVAVVVAMIALRSRFGRIEWLLTFEEATAKAEATGKPIMLYFFAEGDEACARMDKVTFADRAVRAEAAKFVCVRVDGKAEPELTIRYYALGCPAVAFISPDGELLLTVLNEREPDALLEKMRQVLEPPRAVSAEQPPAASDLEPAESPGLAPRNAEPSRGESE